MVQESTNTFSDGLIKDLNPLTTPNSVLTDALNATLLTFNGNELVLQNDMGNAKIEGCKLTEGFTPIGMKENGGILYIISTNGEEMEVGSFPSPEVKAKELKYIEPILNITQLNGLFKNYILTEDLVYPGDPFIVNLNIQAGLNQVSKISGINPKKFYKIKLLSINKGIETDITYLLNDQKRYNGSEFVNDGYWFLNTDTYDEDEYIRTKNYQVYKLKKEGKLALRIELESISNFYIEGENGIKFPTLNASDLRLEFKIHFETESLMDIDTIKFEGEILDLKTGIPKPIESSDIEIINSPSTVTGNDIALNSTDLINRYKKVNIKIDHSKQIVTYKISCKNSIYGITFDPFTIIESIDLTKDPLYWTIIPYFKILPTIDVLNDTPSGQKYITHLAIGKFARIDGIEQRLTVLDTITSTTEGQAVYVLSGHENEQNAITQERYHPIGTFTIGEQDEIQEFKDLENNPILNVDIKSNEDIRHQLYFGHLYNGYLTKINHQATNDLYIINSNNLNPAGFNYQSGWRIPTYDDVMNLLDAVNNNPQLLIVPGNLWNYQATSFDTGFNAVPTGTTSLLSDDYIDAVTYHVELDGFADGGYFGIRLEDGGTVSVYLEINEIHEGHAVRFCTSHPNPRKYQDIEGVNYRHMKIGNLWWMTEDLRTTKYNTGIVTTGDLTLFANNDPNWNTTSTPGYRKSLKNTLPL